MKKILVPTDFSDTAFSALRVAISVARQQKAELLLVNAFRPDVIGYNMPYAVIAQAIREKAVEARARMKALCRMLDREKVVYDCAIKEGEPVNTILRLAREHEVCLIVMGTTGDSGKPGFLAGTVTAGVIDGAMCPVLAIPPGTPVDKPIGKVTYATNLLPTDVDSIRALVELARPVNAVVNILHVAADPGRADLEVKKLHEFMKHVEEEIDYPRFSCELLAGDDVQTELESYVAQGRTDALVLSTGHRGLLGRLFTDSVTGHLAFHSPVPVVAFHHRRNPAINIYAA